MTLTKRRIIIAGIILLLLLTWCGAAFWHWYNRPAPPLVISKETTIITEPLLPDGTPDYAAYLNAEFSKGVTPENNLMVPLLQAIGIQNLHAEKLTPADIRKILQKMGLSEETIPTNGVFVEMNTYSASLPGEIREQLRRLDLDNLLREPYLKNISSVNQHLDLWIYRNTRAFELFRQASRRNKCFSPALLGLKYDFYMLQPYSISRVRSLSQAICIRSLLRLNKGDIRNAWADIVACKRFGRVFAKNIWLIDFLTGISMDRQPQSLALEILADPQMTPAILKDIRRDMELLPSSWDYDKWKLSEQLFAIGMFYCVYRHPVRAEWIHPAIINMVGESDEMRENRLESWKNTWIQIQKQVDINAALKQFNINYERVMAALNVKPLPASQEKLKQLSRQFDDYEKQYWPLDRKILSFWRAPEEKGKKLGNWLSGQVDYFSYCPILIVRAKLNDTFLKLAAALRLYQLDKGQYPDKLFALVPDYLKAIPKDPFDPQGGALRYRKTKDGFMLYSIYENQKDDGGDFDEQNTGEFKQLDFSIVFPPKPEKKKAE